MSSSLAHYQRLKLKGTVSQISHIALDLRQLRIAFNAGFARPRRQTQGPLVRRKLLLLAAEEGVLKLHGQKPKSV
eukprot:CAMPEP_0181439698 /NCGR_PEP_ID=MMETSP1110-20121109/22569_1 /TAXON_ID=174948 /ORGANISM="Symbiodinium sp., Strain CCMP421" /LENGTH=74 /DNA_ID=CAMNT_0023563445 /DNA_START=209 /DNA_END=433 /DNA_ORIENTATION=-